jgi:hypothetical protein
MKKIHFNSFILLKNVKCTKRLVITTCVCNIIKVEIKTLLKQLLPIILISNNTQMFL